MGTKTHDNRSKSWIVATILWMIIIFILSTTYFSSQRTAHILERISTEINFRFLAHLIVYTILGFLASGAIQTNFSWKNKFLITLVVCILYAITDEFHQSFVYGRHAKIMDIGFDFIGMLLALYLVKNNKVNIS